jgi:pimeloyl-ACP methyl ester carboxylesterase
MAPAHSDYGALRRNAASTGGKVAAAAADEPACSRWRRQLGENRMPTRTINGAELYFEGSGSGPPVFFIHGMCGNANVWDDQRERLSDMFRCVAYDRRGHTRSSWGDVDPGSVEMHADDAAALIEALVLAPCVLVASSGGARIGVDVVRRYPALIERAVLSEPPIAALAPAEAGEFMATVKPALEEAIQSHGPRAAVDAFFELVCPGLWKRLDDSRREPYRANHRALFADLQMPPYQVTADDLDSVHVPCLILRGDESHPFLRSVAGRIADAIPKAQLVELKDCGHVTYAERPSEFAAAVRQFVSSTT